VTDPLLQHTMDVLESLWIRADDEWAAGQRDAAGIFEAVAAEFGLVSRVPSLQSQVRGVVLLPTPTPYTSLTAAFPIWYRWLVD
jgi:hypothetical protein